MRRGVIAASAVGAVTVLTWLVSRPVDDVSGMGQVSQLFGMVALAGFACVMAISTRHRLVDAAFGGLDKAYVAHKWLAITSISLVVVHLVTRDGGQMASHGGGRMRGGPGAADLGVPSLLLFVVLAVIALVARQIRYEVWKAVHMLMAIPYAIGLVHYYGSSSYDPWGLTPVSVWLDLVNLVGVASVVYSVVAYEQLAFRHRYTVTGLRTAGHGNLEITGRPVGRGITWRAGQFAFVKFPGHRFGSHPFTISSGPADHDIQFTIRALGDHTSALPATLRLGDTMTVSAASGRFDYTTGGRRQVWIAAGIGITPFRAFLRAGVPGDYSIDLFYSYAAGHGAYLDELAAVPPHIRLHPIDTTHDGRLTADRIAQTVQATQPVDVYFCGPAPMREALRAGLAASGLPVTQFHAEEFGFARPARHRQGRSGP